MRIGARIPVLYSTSLPHVIRVDIYMIPVLEYGIVIGHHYGLFNMDYSMPPMYLPETTSLALYFHNVNKFVLILSYFMWL